MWAGLPLKADIQRNQTHPCLTRGLVAVRRRAVLVIVLNLVQPETAGRQCLGLYRKARRDEPGREGTLQHVG
jgi:hypothetical protein